MDTFDEEGTAIHYVSLEGVPIDIYHLFRKAYVWPADKCTFCGKGSMSRVQDSTIFVCDSCNTQFDIKATS